MITINLRDFYPWYTHDEFVEVPDEVAAELFADKRYSRAHEKRMKRNHVQSLDAVNSIEAAGITYYTDSPEAILEKKMRHCRLCRALNSLPEIQGSRIEAHHLLGMSIKEIAKAEGVSERNVRKAISRG